MKYEIGEKMQKVRLGKKEKELLMYLYLNGEVSVTDLYSEFAHAQRYQPFFGARIKRLQTKGLIESTIKYNEPTKRNRKYIRLSELGKRVVKGKPVSKSSSELMAKVEKIKL